MHQIQLLKKYAVRPHKPSGQNFLIDENIQKKIADRLALTPKDFVVEIGSGLGALTEGLVQSGASVLAVEKDPKLADILASELSSYTNLKIVNKDILKFPPKEWSDAFPGKKPKKFKVVGNLPYFVTSPILFYLIEHKKWIDWAVVMVQKEVAERILAQPGNKDYGRLTLGLRYHADITHEFDVRKNSFTPVPQVDSAVVRMEFHERKIPNLNEELLFGVIKAAFASRRKNILNCLSNGPFNKSRDEWKQILETLKIPTNLRAEELLMKDYIDLSLKLTN